MTGAPLSAAERQRRHRERRKCGLRVVPVEMDQEALAELVRAGVLSDEDLTDSELLSRSLGELFEKLLGRHA